MLCALGSQAPLGPGLVGHAGLVAGTCGEWHGPYGVGSLAGPGSVSARSARPVGGAAAGARARADPSLPLGSTLSDRARLGPRARAQTAVRAARRGGSALPRPAVPRLPRQEVD